MFSHIKPGSTPDVGASIRGARIARKMTLADLAQQSVLTKGFLSQVENGHSTPSLDSLGRIAAALGISVPELLGSSAAPQAARLRTEKIHHRSTDGAVSPGVDLQ